MTVNIRLVPSHCPVPSAVRTNAIASPQTPSFVGQHRHARRMGYVFVGEWDAHPNAHYRIQAAALAFNQPVATVSGSEITMAWWSISRRVGSELFPALALSLRRSNWRSRRRGLGRGRAGDATPVQQRQVTTG
jgi:hypothetical protein